MKKAGIWIIGAGFILAAIWAYFLFQRQPANITLEFIKPDTILAGEPFSLGVSFSNESDKVIENAKLSLILPPGISLAGEADDIRVSEQMVGDIGPGSLNQESFNLIVTDGAQSLKQVEAVLRYNIGGSTSDFEERNETDLAVGQAVAGFTMTVPERVFSGENFEIKVAYENHSNKDMRNVRLVLNYPPNYQFQKASSSPDRGNSEWNFPLLVSGERGEIVISGSLVGPQESFVTISADLVSDYMGEKYRINSQSATVGISTPPLSLEIKAGNSDDYIANIGEPIAYTLHYRNNSNSVLQNATIRATLVGELFDIRTARGDGFFDSSANTMVWNAGNTPGLASITPGGEGAVTLTVQLKPAFPAARLSDKNYTLRVRGQIESPTVPSGTTAGKTLSISENETRVAGRLEVDTLGYFRDAASGILNSGPYPPQVNRATQYTIHWRVRNYSTDVSGLRISAFLQSGAKFTGKIKSSIDAKPTYNAASGEVTWNIGNLAATKGVLGPVIEAVFQIEDTPSSNEVGQDVPLLSETVYEAKDEFTGRTLKGTDSAISSGLPDDLNLGSERMVRP